MVLGRVHGEVEKCFDLISDLKCRDDRYPGRCRRGFGSWVVAVGPVRARGGGGVPQKTFPLARRDRGGGVFQLFAGKDVPGDMLETGAGDVPSPYPASPTPGG